MSNSVLNLALKQASRKLSVDQKLVELVYRSYWKFIKEHISNLNLREMTKEEFDSTDTNFNIPYIGKLYVEYYRIEMYQNNIRRLENVKAKEIEADRLSGTCD